MEQWLVYDEHDIQTQNGYVFRLLEGAPCVAVRGLFGIVTTYYGSYFHNKWATLADIVVCHACWLDWLATPPYNDTPPTLKIPPTCNHEGVV